jgi:hypothetical protein
MSRCLVITVSGFRLTMTEPFDVCVPLNSISDGSRKKPTLFGTFSSDWKAM